MLRLVLAVVFSAPGSLLAQDITVYVGSSVDTLDPHHTTTFAGHVVANTLHQGLLKYEKNGRLAPALAADWTVSSDGLTYIFTLKPKRTWSDGVALDANDVVAGLLRSLNPEDPSPFAAKLYPIENAEAYLSQTLEGDETVGIVALDNQTVKITLHRGDAEFLHVLAHPVAKPAPNRAPNLISDGSSTSGSYIKADLDREGFTLMPRSDGPGLIFRTVHSVQNAWQLSKSEKAFVTTALPIITVPMVGSRGDVVRIDGGESLYAYAVNMTRPHLGTLEVRHALAMAINRADVLSALSIPSTVPATQFVPPSAMTYAKSYSAPFASLTFEEREAVAEALLAEQGLGADVDFVVQLRIPDGDIHRDVAESIANMWAVIGIDTRIIQSPLPEHWNAVEAGDFDLAFVSWPVRRDSPRGSLEPFSRAAGPWNFSRYQFSDFDERLARAAENTKEEVQAGHYREAEKALIEDQSLISLFFYQPLALVSPNVLGWQSNAAGVHPLSDVSLSQRGPPSFAPPKLPLIAPKSVP